MGKLSAILSVIELLLKANFSTYTIWNQNYIHPTIDILPLLAINCEMDNASRNNEDNGVYYRVASIQIDILVGSLPPISSTENIRDEIINLILNDETLDGISENKALSKVEYNQGMLDKYVSNCKITFEIGYIRD